MVDGQNVAGEPHLNVPQDYLTMAHSGLSIEQRIAVARKPWVAENPSDVNALAHRLILQVIVRDAEVRVRQALAETIAANPAAPRDVILALAKDIDQVALPVLSLSDVVTADELVAIVDGLISGQKMAAIATRREVPAGVCDALIDKGDEDTVHHLLRNAGADISEPGMNLILDRHGRRERIQIDVIDRETLPATVVERVVALVSAELLARVVERHRLPATVAANLVIETRDRATLGLATGLSFEATRTLVAQLFEEGRLTPSLLLRSLCTGNLELVIHAIALRSLASYDYVRRRLTEAMPGELEELWGRTDLPMQLLPIAKAAVEVLLQTQVEGAKWDVDHFRRRVMQRMITRSGDLAVEFSDDDIKYFTALSDGDGAVLQDFFANSAAVRA